ncbi:MAG TPA: hypothetical protein VF599_03915 [Pyrinomonadaceae bacterium]|jgi:hypothetical protein
MYYGDDIIITRKGLRIRSKALNPIGIADESVCWGISVPPAPNEKERVPDILISEFHPKVWHVLFRITIELRDEQGTLGEVDRILNELWFNILSTQCAPSGYKHATWNIIGEALDKRELVDKSLESIMEDFHADIDAFAEENDEFRIRLTRDVSLKMLQYRLCLEEEILKRDKEENFLHKRLKANNTLLYWFAGADEDSKVGRNIAPEIKEELTKLKADFEEFEESLPKPVQCRWLKQLATYRIYNQAQASGNPENIPIAAWNNPIRFKFDAATSFLVPQSENDKEKFEEIIKQCVYDKEIEDKKDFPIKTIAAFNPYEHYLRVILPKKEFKNNRVSIQVKYRVKLNQNAFNNNGNTEEVKFQSVSSIGLLQSIAEQVRKRKINLRYLSNSILNFSLSTEIGKISMIGKTEEPSTKKIREEIQRDLIGVAHQRKVKNLTIKSASVEKYGAKTLFLSNKFGYANDTNDEYKKSLWNLANLYGFEVISLENPSTVQHIDTEKGSVLENIVTEHIKKSHAFLQIYSKLQTKDAEKQTDWLLFELGVARGFGIPYAICIDELIDKSQRNSIIEGIRYYSFNSLESIENKLKKIEEALIFLQNASY